MSTSLDLVLFSLILPWLSLCFFLNYSSVLYASAFPLMLLAPGGRALGSVVLWIPSLHPAECFTQGRPSDVVKNN